MKKGFFSVVLTAIMLVLLLPTTALADNAASVTNNGTTIYYVSLKDAIDAVNNDSGAATQEGTVITLLADAQYGGEIKKRCTLDLGGHQLKINSKSANLNIMDDITIKNGDVYDPDYQECDTSMINIPDTNHGTIKLVNVNLTADSAFCMRSADAAIEFNGGVYDVKRLLSCGWGQKNRGKLVINNDDGAGHLTYIRIRSSWHYDSNHCGTAVVINGGCFESSSVPLYPNQSYTDIRDFINSGNMWVDVGNEAEVKKVNNVDVTFQYRVIPANTVNLSLGAGAAMQNFPDNTEMGYYRTQQNVDTRFSYRTTMPLPTANNMQKTDCTFAGWYDGDTKVTTVTSDHNGKTLYARWKYTIVNAAPETDKDTNHGYIAVDKETAITNETVTVTAVVPGDGYELDSLVYTDSTDHDITAAKSFTMPDAKVTITAKFSQMTVAAPVASPDAGIYTSAQTVTLSTVTEGAAIYYTTDGSNPTTSSTKYTAAIPVSASQTIKAIAVKANWIDSEVTTAAYTITGTVAAPVASPAAGTYTSAQTVTLSTVTEGAAIYYTTDGSNPTTSSMKYTAAIPVDADQTIKAIAVKENWENSAVLTAAYTITGTVAAPVASPAAGTYTSAQTVTLSTVTEGAAIYYTTDGSNPTTSSTKYTAAIPVDADQTIKAIAVKENWENSAVLTAEYTLRLSVTKVEVSPDTMNMKPGESWKITLRITPKNAADKTLTVSMDKEGIVSVAEDGTVTALKDGTVKVTYTASSGVTGSCVVTVKADPVPYKIIRGENQTVLTNADQAVFSSNADFSKFDHVEMDGKTVNKKYYTAESGSTVITFKKEFIKTLSIGQHTLSIVSVDGSASTTFLANEPLPPTGDTADLALLMLLMLGSVGAIVFLSCRVKKRDF